MLLRPPRRVSTESCRRPGGRLRSLETARHMDHRALSSLDQPKMHQEVPVLPVKLDRGTYGPNVCQEVVALIPQHLWSHVGRGALLSEELGSGVSSCTGNSHHPGCSLASTFLLCVLRGRTFRAWSAASRGLVLARYVFVLDGVQTS